MQARPSLCVYDCQWLGLLFFCPLPIDFPVSRGIGPADHPAAAAPTPFPIIAERLPRSIPPLAGLRAERSIPLFLCSLLRLWYLSIGGPTCGHRFEPMKAGKDMPMVVPTPTKKGLCISPNRKPEQKKE